MELKCLVSINIVYRHFFFLLQTYLYLYELLTYLVVFVFPHFGVGFERGHRLCFNRTVLGAWILTNVIFSITFHIKQKDTFLGWEASCICRKRFRSDVLWCCAGLLRKKSMLPAQQYCRCCKLKKMKGEWLYVSSVIIPPTSPFCAQYLLVPWLSVLIIFHFIL